MIAGTMGVWRGGQVPQYALRGNKSSYVTFRIGNVTGRPPQPLYKLRQHSFQVLAGRQHLIPPGGAAVAPPPRDKLQAAALVLCTVVDFKRAWCVDSPRRWLAHCQPPTSNR